VTKPPIRYLIASPLGDIPIDESRLDYPLEGDPLKTPYRAYFSSITDFLTKQDFLPLLEAVNESRRTDSDLSALNEIIVRAEKHGALYHPASIECVTADSKVTFGLNVAVTESGKHALRKESAVLKALHSRFPSRYLPVPYHLDESHAMVFLLEEWFEDFHEFHASVTEDGRQLLKLWEYGQGNRLLNPEQGFEIYRQAAQILTLYYDLNTFHVIYPWHHAAGDFVVKTGEASNPLLEEGDSRGFSEKIDVRLTTARGYEPFMGLDEDEVISPVSGLFYFLLHLSIQMRLDRLDGVGDIAWADDFCVDATVSGFFEGLDKKKDLSACCGSQQSLRKLLKSFTKEDLRKSAAPIAEQFDQTKDYRTIQEHLRDHIDKLHLTLQNSP